MPSTLGILSRILEVETENIEMNIPHDRKFGDRYREPSFYGSGLPFSSWNHSTKFGDNLNDGLKTEMDCNDETQIFDIQIQGGGPRNRPNTMDKFLHLQDAVPCKLRAKHGCATHPRSIAERVRRTRISERVRKLQVLVPNMEKFCRRGNSDYLIGIGSYNITGPAADVNMMEYANMEQVASGLHVRLQARTFIVAEPQGNHVVFVNLDACMASQIVTIKVLEKLKERFNRSIV